MPRFFRLLFFSDRYIDKATIQFGDGYISEIGLHYFPWFSFSKVQCNAKWFGDSDPKLRYPKRPLFRLLEIQEYEPAVISEGVPRSFNDGLILWDER